MSPATIYRLVIRKKNTKMLRSCLLVNNEIQHYFFTYLYYFLTFCTSDLEMPFFTFLQFFWWGHFRNSFCKKLWKLPFFSTITAASLLQCTTVGKMLKICKKESDRVSHMRHLSSNPCFSYYLIVTRLGPSLVKCVSNYLLMVDTKLTKLQ